MRQEPQSHKDWFEAPSRAGRNAPVVPRGLEEEGARFDGGASEASAERPSEPSPAIDAIDRPDDERKAAQTRLVQAVSQQKRPDRLTPGDACPPGVFEPEYIAVLFQAFEEARSFLSRSGVLGPARREEIAHIIISQARCGLLDPHRLALKAIAKVG